MGIFETEEQTLFRPVPQRAHSPARRLSNTDENDRKGSILSEAPAEDAALLDPVRKAARAAARRPIFALLVLILGAATTFVAATTAPREYRATAEVLVVRSALAEPSTGAYVVGLSDEQKEYLAQIESRPTVRAVAEALPEETLTLTPFRSPARRALDRIFGARAVDSNLPLSGSAGRSRGLTAMLDRRIHANVDGPRVQISAEWPTPEAAAAIANAATAHFLATRYTTEVKGLEDLVLRAETNASGGDKRDPRDDAAPARLRERLQTARTVFAAKYQVTRDAEVPEAPTKPVTLLATLAGALATCALVLLLASLADRWSGRLYEAKEVRDLLGIPVLGELQFAGS